MGRPSSRSRSDLIAIGPETIEPGGTGGAYRTFGAFLDECRARGLRVEVVDTGSGSVPGWAVSRYRAWVALRIVVLAARNAVRRQPVIWFMSGGMLRTLAPLVPVLARRGPVVVMTFGGWLGEMVPNLRPLHRRIVVRSLARALRVGAQSQRTVDQARRAGVVRAEATGVMRQRPVVAARVDGAPLDPLKVVFVGRVAPQKGIDGLVDLVAAAAGGIVAEVIGPVDESSGEMARLAASPPDGVQLLGARTHAEVIEHLRDATVSILLSSYPGEGLPGSVIESLQVGTPAIVSRFLGLPELVDDGVSGFVVDREDGGGWPIVALAERLQALTPEQWSAMRRAAVAKGVEHTPDRWLPLLLEPLGLEVEPSDALPVGAR